MNSGGACDLRKRPPPAAVFELFPVGLPINVSEEAEAAPRPVTLLSVMRITPRSKLRKAGYSYHSIKPVAI